MEEVSRGGAGVGKFGQHRVCPPQNSVSLDSDVLAVYSCRILVGSEALADATHACSGVPGWTHLHSEENALQDDIMKYAASSKQGHFMQTAPT